MNRVVRLDELDTDSRRLIVALIDADKHHKEAMAVHAAHESDTAGCYLCDQRLAHQRHRKPAPATLWKRGNRTLTRTLTRPGSGE